MAENTAIVEEIKKKNSTTKIIGKGQLTTVNSGSTGTGNKSITIKSLTNMSHSPAVLKSMSLTAPLEGLTSKHHHHHHHHYHHSHHHSHSSSSSSSSNHNSSPHVIHRTTSESLRLGPSDYNSSSVHHPNNSSNNTGSNSNTSSTPITTPTPTTTTTTNCNSTTSNQSGGTSVSAPSTHISTPISTLQRKQKASSFQITSVTVGNKASADNGEDSADDLDESHTDDNSRITDLENETPSMSEDTFSKEDVFFSSNALGAAPVIPTSSQYGLVIVDPDLGGVGNGGQTLSNVHVSVTDAGINFVGPAGTKICDGDQKDLQHRNERFKVVKIESTEPFKRGRWMCMDYLDHTTLQQTQPNPEGGGSGSGPSTIDGTVNPSLENHVDGTGNEGNGGKSDEPTETNNKITTNLQNTVISPGQTLQNSVPTGDQQPTAGVVHAQTLTHNLASSVASSHPPPPILSQSMPHVSIPPTSAPQTISDHLQTQPNAISQPIPNVDFATNNSGNNCLQGQSQPAHFYANNHQQQQQQQPQPHANYIHGATLPTNITMQNGIPSNVNSDQPGAPSHDSSQSIQTVPISASVPSTLTQPLHPGGITSIPTSTNNSSVHIIPHSHTQQPVISSSESFPTQQQVPAQSYGTSSIASVLSTSSTSGLPPNVSMSSQEVASAFDVPVSIPPQPQSSGVISPVTVSAPSTTIENVTPIKPQPASVGQSLTNVVQPSESNSSTATASVSLPVNDPITGIASVPVQPSSVPANPSLQTQQSVVSTEDGLQSQTSTTAASGTGETDTER